MNSSISIDRGEERAEIRKTDEEKAFEEDIKKQEMGIHEQIEESDLSNRRRQWGDRSIFFRKNPSNL